MALLVGVGASQKPEEKEAVEEATSGALQSLAGKPPSLMMMFASPTTYKQEQLVALIKAKCPEATIIGCSTSGEITPTGSFDNSLAVMAIHADKIKFTPGIGRNIKEDPRRAGKELALDILKRNGGKKPQVAIILPDGLAGNGADIVRGVLDVFGKDFQLAGGAAGDDFLFKKTYQYIDGEVLDGTVVGVGLSGDFKFGIGVRHGWIPIGTPRTATKSKSNILYELDGRPAIQIYEDQFGKDVTLISKEEPLARLAITYPLGIAIPGKDEYLIRDPITVDEQGAINCAAEIPEGSQVYIMIGSREEAISAAQDAVRQALAQVEGMQVKAAILFNCIARKKLLMGKKQEEVDKIRSALGSDVPLIGFYTYGEQAPLGGEITTCSFHNETDVIFVLADASEAGAVKRR